MRQMETHVMTRMRVHKLIRANLDYVSGRTWLLVNLKINVT